MPLGATIQRLRDGEEDNKKSDRIRDAVIRRWRNDVDFVYKLFETALKPFVDDGSVQCERLYTEITDDLMGRYQIEILSIDIVGLRIRIVPCQIYLSSGTGRIEIYTEDHTTEKNRITMIKCADATSNQPKGWMIQHRVVNNIPLDILMSAFPCTLFNSSGVEFLPLNDESILNCIDYLINSK